MITLERVAIAPGYRMALAALGMVALIVAYPGFVAQAGWAMAFSGVLACYCFTRVVRGHQRVARTDDH